MSQILSQQHQAISSLSGNAFNKGSPLTEMAQCRQPEITAQIESLAYVAGELEGYIAVVEDKFSKVLQPTEPAKENICGNTPYHTTLGSQLGEITDRMRAMRGRLESILQRAEL